MMLAAALIFIIAIFAIVYQFFSAFFHSPIQASIRALIGLIALLIATLGIPTIEGEVDVVVDWGNALEIDSTGVKISTGIPVIIHAFAWISITTLLSICLFRVPVKKDEPSAKG